MGLFSKNKKDDNAKKAKDKGLVDDVKKEQDQPEILDNLNNKDNIENSGVSFSGKIGSGAYKILKGFYVSEKSSIGNAFDQYTFKVTKNANKSEVAKEVSKLFNVKVKQVKILNMPEKRRDFGKHPGTKSGFKKAIVKLHKGFTIGQAKP